MTRQEQQEQSERLRREQLGHPSEREFQRWDRWKNEEKAGLRDRHWRRVHDDR